MRFGWRLLSILARALEPAERDVILGDLTESRSSIGAAMSDLLGYRSPAGWVVGGLAALAGLVRS
jgi:hypothetical protein